MSLEDYLPEKSDNQSQEYVLGAIDKCLKAKERGKSIRNPDLEKSENYDTLELLGLEDVTYREL